MKDMFIITLQQKFVCADYFSSLEAWFAYLMTSSVL